MKKKIFIALGVIIVIALVVAGLNMGNSGPEAVEVQTAPVEKQRIVETVTATGRIQPKLQVKISADVSAKITKLAVNEGDWVEKGDFLLELDRERYLAAVDRARAGLSSTKAGARLAKENLIKAEKDYHRTQKLFEGQLESQSAMDGALADYQIAKARYESALDDIEQTRASLKQAEDDLSKTTIYAPMSGTISELNKEEGEIALGSQFQEDVIMVISDLSGMEALVNVDENDIVSVAIGDSATVEVDALPDILLHGVVTEIANSARISGAGTAEQKTEFEVKVAIAGVISPGNSAGAAAQRETPVNNVSNQLRPGMTASADIITEVKKEALSIPIQSVALRTMEQLQQPSEARNDSSGEVLAEEKPAPEYRPDKDGFVQVVFVVKNGSVEARQVTTGIQSDTHIEILKGLSEGDEIVTGNYRAISKDLQNGAHVVIQDQVAENN